MKKNNLYIILGIVLLLIVVLLIVKYTKKNNENNNLDNLKLSETIKSYKKRKFKDENMVSTRKIFEDLKGLNNSKKRKFEDEIMVSKRKIIDDIKGLNNSKNKNAINSIISNIKDLPLQQKNCSFEWLIPLLDKISVYLVKNLGDEIINGANYINENNSRINKELQNILQPLKNILKKPITEQDKKYISLMVDKFVNKPMFKQDYKFKKHKIDTI
jgi:hypothetical protein